MFGNTQHPLIGRATGVLARLRRDQRGNALMIMAAMMIPLAGLSGSAIDMGRLYAVKSRLQQACDAGVLAGRKMMTDTSSAPLDATATAAANAFFANNFKTGWYQTNTVAFSPSKTSDFQVQGTASAVVPMTIMKMFGFTTKTVNVTCAARYDVADADIMFVLDTTGSMACLTSDSQSDCDGYASNTANITQDSSGTYAVTEKPNSRLSGLRAAVLNFFDVVTSQADTTTNFRFGFVPYSATANVGKLLQPLGYVAGSWTYQSRENSGDTNYGAATSSSPASTQASCPSSSTRSPATGYNNSGTATVTTVSYASGKCTTTSQPVGPAWKYKPVTFDVSQYILGGAVDNPTQVTSGQANSSSTWQGCIEERATVATSTFSATSPPLDLDVDQAPSAGVAGSYWGPLWPDVEYARLSLNEVTGAARTITARPVNSSTMYEGYAVIANELPCPLRASRLSTMTLPAGSNSSAKSTLRSTIQTYLSSSNGFRPYGVTYHDVGMTWGTRLIAPAGIFASDTSAWSGHNAPNRYIIFLTDGALQTDQYAYASHGIEAYDQRVTGGSVANLTAYHNTRFTTACQIAKNHNITVFVIAFAQTLTSQLQSCASPGQAYYASDTNGLNTAFGKIAQQVAMLRVSK